MFEDTKRAFRRAAKNRRHEKLTLDDISVIRPQDDPDTTYSIRARRQHNSEYWKIYGPGNLILPRDWSPMTLESGLTLEQALDSLQKHEAEYADALRGKKGIPYNHYSKIRTIMEEEDAAQAAAAAAAATPVVETTGAVGVSKPLTLKMRS